MKNNVLFFSLVLTIALVAPSFANAELNADIDPEGESTCIFLQNNMRYRSTDGTTGGEVSILQDFLQANEYLNSNPTGFFGLLTLRAVKKFQTASGIEPTGFVGPLTRAKIQLLTCGTPGSTQPSITVVSPSAWEDLKEGSQYTIKWSSQNLPPGSIIAINIFNGESRSITVPNLQIAYGLPLSTTSYTWTVKGNDGRGGQGGYGVGMKSLPQKIARILGIEKANAGSNQYFITVEAYAKPNGEIAYGASKHFTISPAGPTAPSVLEKVKCVFHNSTVEQWCASIDGQYKFSGVGTAGGDIGGVYGSQLTWKSNCSVEEKLPVTTFDGVNEYVNFNCGITSLAPIVKLSASPTTILSDGKPGTVTLYWSSENATSCLFEKQILPTIGSLSVSISQTGTFSISCTGSGGTASSNPVTVTFQLTSPSTLPTASLTVSSTHDVTSHEITVNVGDTVKYAWSSTNASWFYSKFTSTTCGSGVDVMSSASGTYSWVTPQTSAGCAYTTTYYANSNTGAVANDTVTIKVNKPVLSASLTANGSHDTTVNIGDIVKYAWSSTNGTRFDSSYTSPSCGSGASLANSASGTNSSWVVLNTSAGCTYTVTYYVHSSSGAVAKDTVIVRVNKTATSTTQSSSDSNTASAITPFEQFLLWLFPSYSK